MKRTLVSILTASCLTLAVAAHAKIAVPQPSPEQEAKAAEAKAKAAEAAKKESELVGKAQDRAAENYKKGKGKAIASAPVKRK